MLCGTYCLTLDLLHLHLGMQLFGARVLIYAEGMFAKRGLGTAVGFIAWSSGPWISVIVKVMGEEYSTACSDITYLVICDKLEHPW